MQILPGSANLFGGRSVTVKNVPARSVYAMKFPGAPYGLKMACGENPKRVYGSKGRAPSTRMGNVAGYRAAWIKAQEVPRRLGRVRAQAQGRRGRADPPDRDLQLETLAGVLDGDILVQNHCYRADEMITMIDIAKEFGYKISAFHHGVEAYKIADVLAANNICADVWADWWGFKMEALDGIRENAALLQKAGACVVIHSDSAEGIQRLNQEAAKAMAAGNRMGMNLREEDAIRWLTINPAKSIGIDQQTGSLEAGQDGRRRALERQPVQRLQPPRKVYIDGALVYDRNDPSRQPETDFELGIRDAREVQPMRPAAAFHPSRRPRGLAGAAAARAETVVITNAAIHTMGPQGTIKNGTLVIENGRIRAVGAAVSPPASARRIDAHGKLVTPGLFDSYSQIGLVEVNAVDGTEDAHSQDDQITAAFNVADAFNPALDR